VYFSWRQEKYQKNRPVQLGLRLPSRKRFFRRGQELARFAVLKQPARFFPKKSIFARLRCNGQALPLMPRRGV